MADITHSRATYQILTEFKDTPPQLGCLTHFCPDCGEDGSARGKDPDGALKLRMATYPNQGHRSWRLAWHIPEPVT